jgi:hypothetical protein
MSRRRLKARICVTCSLVYMGDSCYRCAHGPHSRKNDNRVDLAVAMIERSRAGQKCAECGATFLVDRGDRKRLAIFSNGHGYSYYMLCFKCGQVYERGGPKALPRVMEDCKMAVFMSQVATPVATSLVQ